MDQAKLNELFQMFVGVVNELAASYECGLLKKIREKYPESAQRMEKVEDQVNECWLNAQKGTEGSYEKFVAAVKAYKSTFKTILNFVKSSG
jgi:hypothetical protein